MVSRRAQLIGRGLLERIGIGQDRLARLAPRSSTAMAADTRAAGDASACLVISASVLIAPLVWDYARDRMSHGGFAIRSIL